MTTATTQAGTRWWHKADNGKVVCTLCPRECHIPEGSRGFCFVRANVDGELALTTYGRSSGFCIDPIEKKPLNHFLPGSPVLSLGTAGCNLGCKFCQNWDISKSREMDTLASYAGPEDIVRAAKETGCRSIAFTYNDPTIWAEYAIDIAKVARQEGIKTVAVTAGYISPEARGEFYQWMDAANVDLKAFTETFYRKLTQTQLAPVLDTLKYLKHETHVWFELTNLMIPGENDSPDETREMCDWIVSELGADVPIHFSAFHPDYKLKDKPRTPHETLIRARQIALDAGLHYAYVGNVYDVHRESTYCHNCGEMLIERDWYELGRYRMKGNRCGACDAVIPGVFDDQPGNWGRRRQPVHIQGQPPREQSVTELNVSASPRRSSEAGTAGGTAAKLSSANAPSAVQAPAAVQAAAATNAAPVDAKVDQPQVRIDFDDQQCEIILNYTRSVVRDAITGEADPEPLPVDLATAPAFGLFVSLKRGGVLRACRGRWGDSRNAQLGALLSEVARDTACYDTRFPSITPGEIDLLDIEVSLMHSPGLLSGSPAERAAAVHVGTHGLVLLHPGGRGLLLPQVASENKWDGQTFLGHLARKAGLPAEAALDPRAQVMTFEARVLCASPGEQELAAADLSESHFEALAEHVQRIVAQHGDVPADLPEVLTQQRAQVIGVHLTTAGGLTGISLGSGKSVSDMAQAAAHCLREMIHRKHGPAEADAPQHAVTRLALLHQPIFLKPQDYPHRTAALAGHALAVKSPSGFNLSLPDGASAAERLEQCLRQAGASAESWSSAPADHKVVAHSVTAFTVRQMSPATAAAGGVPSHVGGAGRSPRAGSGLGGSRAPARAGQFYPAAPQQVLREVERHLQRGAEQQPGATPARHQAIMLPHAGWRFCGDVIGQVLAHVHVPQRIIILGPRHTPYGPQLSVAPHDSWQLPTGDVTIDADMRQRLLRRMPAMQAEPDAHRMEHGSEVLLPFLQQLNSAATVTPVVVGQLSFDETTQLADAIAETVDETAEPVLLVISSDMNHFAPDHEGRRLDAMALEAMQSGDPVALYRTCREHQISMCGVLPAVTIMQAIQKQTPRLDVNVVAYATSAEAGGDASSVVGYAGALLN